MLSVIVQDPSPVTAMVSYWKTHNVSAVYRSVREKKRETCEQIRIHLLRQVAIDVLILRIVHVPNVSQYICYPT